MDTDIFDFLASENDPKKSNRDDHTILTTCSKKPNHSLVPQINLIKENCIVSGILNMYCFKVEANISPVRYFSSYSNNEKCLNTVINLFGRVCLPDGTGESICVHIHGFLQTFYVVGETWRVPFLVMAELEQKSIAKMKEETSECGLTYEDRTFLKSGRKMVQKIEYVKSTDEADTIIMRNLLEKPGQKRPVFKISVSIPRYVDYVSKVFLEDEKYKSHFSVYENQVSTVTRFILEHKIKAPSSLLIPENSFVIRDTKRETNCSVEIDMLLCNFQKFVEITEAEKPPLRLMSFDIETLVEKEIKVDGSTPIRIIAALLFDYNPTSNAITSIDSVVLSVGECDSFSCDARVESFYDTCLHVDKGEYMCDICWQRHEAGMLQRFSEVVCDFDCDVVSGHNVKCFDLASIQLRLETLQTNGFIKEKLQFGRFVDSNIDISDGNCRDKLANTRSDRMVTIPGRLVFDTMELMRRFDSKRYECMKNKYTLKSLAARFLDIHHQKHDVDLGKMNDMYKGNSRQRSEVAAYCYQDSLISAKLLDVGVNAKKESILRLLFSGCSIPIQFTTLYSEKYLKYLKYVFKTKRLIV